MLDHAVNALTRLDAIEEDLYQLGVRHGEYGIDEAHFETAATALLTTLREVLGDDNFTKDVETAWATAYWILAGVMKKGMRFR
jgi:hemoglobin-like flavoprotein